MAEYIWGDKETQFFFELNPDLVLGAVDRLGLKTTGRCLTLNSMENRVFEVEIECDEAPNPSDRFRIVKFYRPGRWSKEQILDEHQFLLDLVEAEIPAIPPIQFNGETLFKLNEVDIWYCLFKKKGGRNPDEMNEEQLEQLGRFIARLHNVGANRKATHRIEIGIGTFGKQNLEYLLSNKIIPSHIEPSYKTMAEKVFELAGDGFDKLKKHRIHGDCHVGNIIWNEKEGPFFIDFDDMLTGPAVQDIWLVVGGRDNESLAKRTALLSGYEMMREFDYSSLKYIELLRTLRYIHFSAWIAKRWEDPYFKQAFSHFNEAHYWEIQVQDLREQVAHIEMELNKEYHY